MKPANEENASRRTKIKILVGLVAIFLFSIVMGVMSSPMSGITNFFILTVLLWALAKTRHWI
jgi:hypothetical protein